VPSAVTAIDGNGVQRAEFDEEVSAVAVAQLDV
jgi:hypothetical protein